MSILWFILGAVVALAVGYVWLVWSFRNVMR